MSTKVIFLPNSQRKIINTDLNQSGFNLFRSKNAARASELSSKGDQIFLTSAPWADAFFVSGLILLLFAISIATLEPNALRSMPGLEDIPTPFLSTTMCAVALLFYRVGKKIEHHSVLLGDQIEAIRRQPAFKIGWFFSLVQIIGLSSLCLSGGAPYFATLGHFSFLFMQAGWALFIVGSLLEDSPYKRQKQTLSAAPVDFKLEIMTSALEH